MTDVGDEKAKAVQEGSKAVVKLTEAANQWQINGVSKSMEINGVRVIDRGPAPSAQHHEPTRAL